MKLENYVGADLSQHPKMNTYPNGWEKAKMQLFLYLENNNTCPMNVFLSQPPKPAVSPSYAEKETIAQQWWMTMKTAAMKYVENS